MTGLHSRKFTLALLAQVVFCLVAAPILAAERWVPPEVPAKPASNEARHEPVKDSRDSRPLLSAAFDASDVRPEEVSSAEQTREKSRSKIGRGTRDRGIGTGSGITADQFEGLPPHPASGTAERVAEPQQLRGFQAFLASPAIWVCDIDRSAIQVNDTLRDRTECRFANVTAAPLRMSLFDGHSSVQPTGPPIC